MAKFEDVKFFGSYDKINTFVQEQYFKSPIYALGDSCFLQEDMRNFITLWFYWWRGYVSDFHEYTSYNGKDYVKNERRTLKMAKKVCEDKASYVVNEKLTVIAEKDQEFIDDVLGDNNFRERLNELIERFNAMGTGSLNPYIKNGEIEIDFVQTQNIIPISINKGIVTDCAFASEYTINNKTYVYICTHLRVKPIDTSLDPEVYDEINQARLEKGIGPTYDGYVIENALLENTQGEMKEVDLSILSSKMQPCFITNTTTPLFNLMTPAKANNISLTNVGLGVSCFSDALSQLEGIDIAYDSYVNEFQSGKMRMFVHDSLAQIDISESGAETVLKPVFDKKEATFYALNMEDDAEKIKHVQPILRIDEHEKGLSDMVNLFGFMCGMGDNYYKFENGIMKTATEVISSDSELAKSIEKDRHVVKRAIIGMIKGILSLRGLDENQSIDIEFDDSIFEDKNAKSKTGLAEFNADIIDRVQYFMDVNGLDEEAAIKKATDIAKRQAAEMPMIDVEDGE